MNTKQQTQNLDVAIQTKRDEMFSHVAWHGELTGSEAESLLWGQIAGTYLLRQGEKEDHFYLSYIVGNDLFHLPVRIDQPTCKWFYQNGCFHYGDELKEFICEIAHREEDQCHPLVQFAKIR